MLLNSWKGEEENLEFTIIGSIDFGPSPSDRRDSVTSSEFSGSRSALIHSRQNSTTSIEDLEVQLESKPQVDTEMFANLFYPSFPAYHKRSSFFVITLEKNAVNAYTYNWRKDESQKFFLKLLKIVNWAK
jgi:hypothetical protein